MTTSVRRQLVGAMPRKVIAAIIAIVGAWIGSVPGGAAYATPPRIASLTVRIDHVVNEVNPVRSLGTTVDRLPVGAAAKTMVQPMLGRILSMGLRPVSYRQNTELRRQAWHWNPAGSWSDAAKAQGYFVGTAKPGRPIINSWGYNLPDQGSSLVDGNLKTYWKSNPYLADRFTHEPDSKLPQWAMVNLGELRPVNAIRIVWANPYAVRYVVQYWTNRSLNPRFHPVRGIWRAFRHGVVGRGGGGTVTLKLTPFPVEAKYVRVLMFSSSDTCDDHGAEDIRNCVGYAIDELYVGMLHPDGSFTNFTRTGHPSHGDDGGAATEVSSVDPWHTASDLSKADGSQTGFDFFFRSGIVRPGAAAMIPIAMLYSNPQTAANEVAYLDARHYPVSYIEMGEEPDGQWMGPDDYAALYIQFADAIHRLVPDAKLGGPVFEGHNRDVNTWPDAEGRVSWLGRFIGYLKAHGRLKDLSFVSFEHYPLACDPGWDTLYREPYLIQHVLRMYRADGVPGNIPLFVTETNLSSSAGEKFEQMFGALWEADYVGAFFEGGGAATYLFHGIPIGFYGHCGPGGGTFGSINVTQEGYSFKGYLSQYFAIRILATEWFEPVDQAEAIYRVNSSVTDPEGDVLVSAYALRRPDGLWSVLVVNNDESHPHTVHILFDGGRERDRFEGKVTAVTFGPAQYRWYPNAAGEGGIARPDGPPATATVTAAPDTTFTLPAASITVLRGHIKGLEDAGDNR